ncbi:branched-chain amino acid ABC transporter permease [Actinotalea sp. Marseille-Q4924]|uniref:branched-chain amino acid ABC transporter permease n=1 Tax=Actinotalea sp. Marseille-Q4924 TaxID=2866571 RepID=UPI001CE3F38A|nr:branched-chain amino acid ABC transporter permease [Actinotalea sp. Marseille-Q4924]
MTRDRKVGLGAMVLVLVALASFPYLGTSGYQVSIASTVLIAAILASTVNLLAADGGMASLGHGAIAGAAAYGAGWASLQGHPMVTQVLVAMGVGVLVTFVYGVLSMRTNGIYFLMVTLALGMVVFGLAYRLSSVTRGENGITGIERPDVLAEPWMFYLFLVACFAVTTGLLWVVSSSPFGATMRGIRDSESRMRSLGYYVPAYKLGAFMISGTVASFAGLLAVWHTHFVSPSATNLERSVLLIVMVILGGLGTTLGPLVGAAIVILVENVVSNSVERWPTVLGLIFIFVILFARSGLVGSAAKLVRRRRRGDPDGSGDPEPAEPAGLTTTTTVP